MNTRKEKKFESLYDQLARAKERAREAVQYVETMEKRIQQESEAEILAEIRKMQEEGDTVFTILKRIEEMQNNQKGSEVAKHDEI